MAVFSLFASANVAAFPDDVDDLAYSDVQSLFNVKERYNVLYSASSDIEMDASDTRTFDIGTNTLTDWKVIVLYVNGWIELQITGKDTDGTTTINGYQRAYGNDIYPGILMVSTYNISSLTLKCLQDDTTVKLLGCVACTDSDTRYTTNA